MQTVHSSELYPLKNGQAQLRYIGFKYPETHWAGLIEQVQAYETQMTEIGIITLEAKGDGPLYGLEHKVLAMAKNHGAHLVLIDCMNCFDVKQNGASPVNSCVRILGRCQRFEL